MPMHALLHEVRNCLAAVQGNLFLLKRIGLPDAALEPVERLERVSASLQRLADATLHPRNGVPSSSAASLSRAAELCARDHFPGRDIQVSALGSDAVDEEDWCLVQIFLNLYRNAFEAGANRIEVECGILGDRVVARVGDDGGGCPETALARLFQKGYTLKRQTGGSGLGLHFVRTVVESRNGTVSARNRPGPAGSMGMEFVLAFPAPRSVLY